MTEWSLGTVCCWTGGCHCSTRSAESMTLGVVVWARPNDGKPEPFARIAAGDDTTALASRNPTLEREVTPPVVSRKAPQMKLIPYLLAMFFALGGSLAHGQSSGGGSSSGGASSTGGAGSSGTAAGSMSSSGTVNGTGGSPGPNTSNALSHGTTGSRLGNPSNGQTNSGTSSAASGFANDPTMNKAVQDLGTTKTGIMPGH